MKSRRSRRSEIVVLGLLGSLAAWSCSGPGSDGPLGGTGGDTGPDGSGGANSGSDGGNGGVVADGGSNQGGDPGLGGDDGLGGAAETGGDSGDGGAEGSGGDSGDGGDSGSGGETGDGGAEGSGGDSGDGGDSGSGGDTGSGGGPSFGPAPLGLVAFFDESSCPSDWEEATAARGRLLVSTTSSAAVGTIMGSPLGNGENRAHTHTWSGNASAGGTSVATSPGGNSLPGIQGTIPLSGILEYATSGLPFTQLLACRLAEDEGGGDPFPALTVAHFDAESCPEGWALKEDANGRMLLPAPSTSGVLSGSGNSHMHPVTGGANLMTTSLAASAGAGVTLASSNPVSVTGATVFDTALGGLPTLNLLVCEKESESDASAVVPAGTLTYFNDDTCDSGFEEATEFVGRFLVGLPSGGTLGLEFGGPDLSSAEERPHTHTFTGNGFLSSFGVSATGGGGLIVGAAGSVIVGGMSQPEGIHPLRLELRYCRKL